MAKSTFCSKNSLKTEKKQGHLFTPPTLYSSLCSYIVSSYIPRGNTEIMFWLMIESNLKFIEMISRDQTPH